MFLSKSTRLLSLFVLTVMTGACSSGDNALAELTPEITRYQTRTPTRTPQDSSGTIESGEIPLPTPTPFIYTVVEGDNLSIIASRFNVSLEVLIAANAGIDPQFMSVGTELIIPVQEGSIAGELPSPTPVALAFDQPRCYPTAARDLWCFLLVENKQAISVENLAARIRLYSSAGELVSSQEAVALINALPSGSRIPLVTFFESPVPAWTSASAQILSALAIPDDDERYLPAEIRNVDIAITGLGSSARIQGQIDLPSGSPSASLIWIVAVAYDQEGIPVGIRRWEHISEILPGSSLNFYIEVFSLGAPIETVELMFEVRP